MHVVSANVILADIATEFDVSYAEASQVLYGVLDDDTDQDDDDDTN